MDPEALNFDSEALEDDASCAYIASAAAFVSVPERIYNKCPADLSFTSTKDLNVKVSVCGSSDSSCTSTLSSNNVSLGSYNTLTIPSVDMTSTIWPLSEGVLKLSSMEHAPTTSSAIIIDAYDSNSIQIQQPVTDTIVYACGTYDITWTSPVYGPAFASAYDVVISDASNNQVVSTIASNVTSGTATWSVSPSTYLDMKNYTIEIRSSMYCSSDVTSLTYNQNSITL